MLKDLLKLGCPSVAEDVDCGRVKLAKGGSGSLWGRQMGTNHEIIPFQRSHSSKYQRPLADNEKAKNGVR